MTIKYDNIKADYPIYLDFKKSYDLMPHKQLIKKLLSHSIE